MALFCTTAIIVSVNLFANSAVAADGYRVQAGDSLRILVWCEEDLQQEVMVRPDGYISFPRVGDIKASERLVDEIREDLAAAIEDYIPDPVVTVQVVEIIGNGA
ncbi:MAG: polysaccharide biosynthesis/export family protein [Pseudomonadota bacterium]